MKEYPQVVVVIANWCGVAMKYKGKPILDTCIKSGLKVDYPDVKFVMVDGDSSDESVKFVRSHYPKVKVKVASPDLGLSNMYNEGFQFAMAEYPKAKYLVVAANDLIFTNRDWLRRMVEAAESDPKIGMVGCRLMYPDGRVQSGGIRVTGIGTVLERGMEKAKTSRYVETIATPLALFRKAAFVDVGGNDEVIYPFVWDDIDLSSRLRSKGWKLYHVGNASVTHLESYTAFTEKVKKKWSKHDIELGVRRNGYIYYLRWNRGLFPLFLITDTVSNFVAIGGGFRLRKNIPERIGMQWPALTQALKMYKTTKLRKFKS